MEKVDQPLVSVVMSVFDENFLSEAIDSILGQSYNNFEYIIINDNPNNDSLKLVLEQYAAKDSRIVLIENEKNLGLGASLNRGLSVAQGKYIARMDSDDISLPARLAKQVEYLESHNEVDLLGTWTKRIDENGQELGIMRFPNKHDILAEMLKFTSATVHPTWMFRAEVLDELEGYRPFPVAQDYDFMYRMVDKGLKISNLQEVFLLYRVTTRNLSVKNFMKQWRCRLYIYRLHCERLKRAGDSFSEDTMQQVLDINPLHKYIYNLSHFYFEKSANLKRNGSFIQAIIFLIISVLIYPGKLKVLYGAFRSRLLMRQAGL